MAMWLRQSTASQEILLGPFLSSTDGNTQMTALSITNISIRLWKEGSTSEISKNSGGATHIANGRYYAVLDATDTDTLGKLEINLHVANTLPVRREYMVIPPVVFDALVLGTDNLDVSAVQLAGQTITAAAGVTFPSSVASPTNITGGTITTVTTTTNLTNLPSIPAGWLTAAGIASSALNGKGDWNVGKTGYSLTQTFPSNFGSLSITAGGLVDPVVASVAGAVWNAATASYGTANTFGELVETNLDAAVSSISAGSGPSAADIADAVWDEALASHATAGSAGAGVSAAGSAGDPWATLIPGSYGAGTAGQILGDNIDAAISSISAGSGPTAAAIRAEIDANSTQLAAILADTAEIGAAGAGLTALASASGLSTLTGYVDTEVAAIKAKTDNLPSDPADASDIATAFSGVNTKLDTIDDFLDTEIAAIKTKTDFLPSATAGADGGLFIAGSNAATTVNFTGTISTVTNLSNLPSIPSGWLTAAGIAAGALDNKGNWNVGKTGYSLTQAFPANFSSLDISVAGEVTAIGGGGGGTADWTADQITAISAILGVPASGTTPTDPTSGILDTIRNLGVSIKAKTDNLPTDPADASVIASSFTTVNTKLDTIDDLVDTEVGAIKTVVDAIQVDTNDIQTRIPSALVGGRMDTTLGAINNSTTDLAAFQRAVKGNVIGTVGGGSTTTSIVSSSLTPAGSVADKFKGRQIVFASDTTTANLRGQATEITANTSSAAPTFTVVALTTAPVSSDTFSIL